VRDQIFAEAVAREPEMKLWLDRPELEAAHQAMCDTRREENTFEIVLDGIKADEIIEGEFRVSSASVLKHLQDQKVSVGSTTARDAAKAMRLLGFAGPKPVRIKGSPVKGFVRAKREADGEGNAEMPF
jgi:hypothetical protein